MNAMTAHTPERAAAADQFVIGSGWEGAQRRFLAGDASFRRYERVVLREQVAVLMDAPPPWEDVRPFLAVTRLLAGCGVTVPNILAQDEAQGFLLLEDLGDQSFSRVLRQYPERERAMYLAAVEALLAIGSASNAQATAITAQLQPYDHEVYLREVALFSDWFLPQALGMEKARALRAEYLALWATILEASGLEKTCLVHRDYHADNLLWVAERAGHHAVGMIDYQDALWGDPAYDLVSLLEDARRDVSPEAVNECIARFLVDSGAQAQAFKARYAVLAAQRNAKIIGIFTRLCVRDGKAHYLDYLPRVWGHFLRDLQHPVLKELRVFIEQHVPESWRGSFVAKPEIGSISHCS